EFALEPHNTEDLIELPKAYTASFEEGISAYTWWIANVRNDDNALETLPPDSLITLRENADVTIPEGTLVYRHDDTNIIIPQSTELSFNAGTAIYHSGTTSTLVNSTRVRLAHDTLVVLETPLPYKINDLAESEYTYVLKGKLK